MNVVEAPDIWEGTVHQGKKGIFLAGGITGCPDWQYDLITLLNDYNGATLLNPRRANFPIDDPNASEQQITWERLHLNTANCILFWFPKETLCPIVLFELGAALYGPERTLIIGTHPEYKRRQDVEIQTKLIRPDLEIYSSLIEMKKQVMSYVNETYGKKEYGYGYYRNVRD